MVRVQQSQVIAKINHCGVLLVYPVKNQKEPSSIWSELWPKKKMSWDWSEDSDDRVARMWYLMKKLSANMGVVYSKWYQGRATFFSREVFTALLVLTRPWQVMRNSLSPAASEILEALEMDSPLSTKQLKEITGLQGRLNEPTYQRAMKELFQKFLIVGFGEVEDGAFPSLAVGATRLIHEELWLKAQAMSESRAVSVLQKSLPPGSKFRKFFDKTITSSGRKFVTAH